MKTVPEGRYLGILCKRKHDWEDTGKSLRYKRKVKVGPCVFCERLTNTKRYEAHKEKILLKKRNRYSKNRERLCERARVLYKENKERRCEVSRKNYLKNRKKIQRNRSVYASNPVNKARARARQRAYSETLTGGYVRKRLTEDMNIKARDVSEELVELKRAQLKLSRLLKRREVIEIEEC